MHCAVAGWEAVSGAFIAACESVWVRFAEAKWPRVCGSGERESSESSVLFDAASTRSPPAPRPGDSPECAETEQLCDENGGWRFKK